MNRIALVTGAAGGIGRATVEVFASNDWEVIALDRQSSVGFSSSVTFRQVDVALPDQVEEFFAWLAERTDGLHAIVNNAAIQICKPLVEMSVEEWDAVLASNLRSIFLTARHGFPLLRAAKGAVVNVSSVHAVATSVEVAAYAASKAGILALTRAMALEFASAGVRVNAILPGAIDTPMLRAGLGRGHVSGDSVDERMAHLARRTAMGRVGQPAEIAHAIRFLADAEQSSFVTGQTLIVDGGATARLSTE